MTAAPYYADDFVELYLGDCLDETTWLAADVLVTDPPYGIAMTRYEGDRAAKVRNGDGKRAARSSDMVGDQDTSTRDSVLDAWGDRPAIVFGSWRVPRPARTRSMLIWHKEGAYSGPLNAAFFTNHEEIYVLGEGAWRRSAPPLRSVITTREHRSQAVAKLGHPTPKPVGLMETLLDRCPPGTIADPFAGSGATLIAARNLGRRAIGAEIDERYCELIARRLSQQAFDFSDWEDAS